MTKLLLNIVFIGVLIFSNYVSAVEIIEIKHQKGDMTTIVRKMIAQTKATDLKIVFEKGNYLFLPDYATSKYSYITNHGNGLKRIVFLLEKFIEIKDISEEILKFEFAEDALKYLDKIEQKDWPDLMFLDIHMPVMSGFDFLTMRRRNDWHP